MTIPNNYGDILRSDDGSFDDKLDEQENMGALVEVGGTGLQRAAGTIDEEFLPALRGRKAVRVFREMALNDSTVASLLFSVEQLLRQVTWTVVGAGEEDEHEEAVQFVEECMEDMSHTWDDMIAEILSCLTYGWSWHEVVYKRRIGPWEKDPRKRSKHSDGMIGWRKIPIRSQETLLRWVFDDHGGVRAMVQIPPPYYQTHVIPIERSLLFRTRHSKGNPEGISMLRGAYRSWFFKKRLEEFEAIGVERDLAGMPVARVPSDYMKAPKGSHKHMVYQAFKKMVQNVRRDEHEGLVLPQEFDSDTKQPLFDFELLSSGGSRVFDTNALINRYEQRILQTVLADFIMLGHQGQGSYAMHVDKTGIFRAALNSIAEMIADVFNRYAIPRLFEVNGMKPDQTPRIEPSNVDPPNLTELSTFMTSMSGLGMQFFPDPDLEKYLRSTAHLPDIPEDQMDMRRDMANQQRMTEYIESRMQAAGAEQKDEMVEQEGMSPEQAEQLSAAPTPEQSASEEIAQYKGSAMAGQDPDVAEGRQVEAEEEEMQALAEQEALEEEAASEQEEEFVRRHSERMAAARGEQDQPADPREEEFVRRHMERLGQL